MVPTGLIAAVKPNTLKSTQRALRELRFTSVEPTKTVITTSMNYFTLYKHCLRFEFYVINHNRFIISKHI